MPKHQPKGSIITPEVLTAKENLIQAVERAFKEPGLTKDAAETTLSLLLCGLWNQLEMKLKRRQAAAGIVKATPRRSGSDERDLDSLIIDSPYRYHRPARMV